jgi:predicted  nucleic acid-binding Zn-ribbon protein
MRLKVNNLMVLVAVAIAAMYAFGILSPMNDKYKAELDAYMAESDAKVDSLENHITLLDIENDMLQLKVDSAFAALDVEEEKRKQERDAFNRKISQLSKLTPSELASYFTERYSK